jgi:GTP-binding protein HflX
MLKSRSHRIKKPSDASKGSPSSNVILGLDPGIQSKHSSDVARHKIRGSNLKDTGQGSFSERTFLLHVSFQDSRFLSLDFNEFITLAEGAGADVVGQEHVSCKLPKAKYLIGSGKLEEIKAAMVASDTELLLVDYPLSASQIKNIQTFVDVRVLDRTGLILDIFAKRARTHEGQLQVELAQLRYHATHLVGEWTHLERQRGGGIGMTGPGEKQLELDRRILRTKISRLEADLDKVRARRALGRARRNKQGLLTVVLVGYTNSGKSTLFNRLTTAEAYVANQLFATLDPTVRQVKVEGLGEVVFIDTVGFIRALPHDLVAAFRATLEEVLEADLLLHVIDASDPKSDELKTAVEEVLTALDANGVPVMEVYNKIDLAPQLLPEATLGAGGEVERVNVSATHGTGETCLLQSVVTRLSHEIYQGTLQVPVAKSKLRALLYDKGYVQAETIDEQGDYLLTLLASRTHLTQTCAAFDIRI